MANTIVDDDLWAEFHRVVNMTSRELGDWLRADAAGEEAEALPDQAGTDLGQAVLAILGKRRADVTPDDVEVMQRVVDKVRGLRGGTEELEPEAGDDRWRHRLMRIGHDPLKPVD